MRIEAAAFTDRGAALGETLRRLVEAGSGDTMRVTRCGGAGPGLSSWLDEVFPAADALLFVGAAGIAVRALAGRLADKLRDPAVVVMDEAGRFAIPILSGHYGGANALAGRLAAHVGATPVVTTATDVNGLFAVDVWARGQGLAVGNPEAVKRVSGKLLRGETVGLHGDFPIGGTPPAGVVLTASAAGADVIVACRDKRTDEDGALILIPPALVLGVGCKKGTPATTLDDAYREFCAAGGIFPAAVCMVCSIDLKRDEPGLVEFCRLHAMPLRVFSARELNEVPGDFAGSAFVAATTGVDNVCERGAVLGSGGRLVVGKTVVHGVALAMAVRRYEVFFPGD